jgi:hypothetical protein
LKILPLEETALTLSELEELMKDGPVILTRNGQPWLMIEDVSGSDQESISLSSNPRFMALIEASRRSHREKKGIGLNDLRREIGLEIG